MKRALILVFGIGLLSVGGVAQDKPAGALRSDFVIVVRELDVAASKKLGLKPTEFKSSAGIVTRDEVIAQMTLLFDKYQPKFRVTPRPYDVYPEIIDKHNSDPKISEQLRKLSRWGVIGPVSQIVTNKGNSLSEEELGDAVGYFYSQIMIYVHQPDPKWTPALSGGE
ncbi:MAG: hypothetical protein ACKVQS_13445 [Fimbriimonadaceae bacterium]